MKRYEEYSNMVPRRRFPMKAMVQCKSIDPWVVGRFFAATHADKKHLPNVLTFQFKKWSLAGHSVGLCWPCQWSWSAAKIWAIPTYSRCWRSTRRSTWRRATASGESPNNGFCRSLDEVIADGCDLFPAATPPPMDSFVRKPECWWTREPRRRSWLWWECTGTRPTTEPRWWSCTSVGRVATRRRPSFGSWRNRSGKRSCLVRWLDRSIKEAEAVIKCVMNFSLWAF